MELFEAIKNRRSIRRYKTDPVDDTQIEAILEAGRWAPSWANTQCWRFVVIRDTNIKTQLAATLMKVKLPDREIPNPALNAMGIAPVVIAVCAQIGIAGVKHDTIGENIEYATDKGDWFMFDVALAIENMVLAAHGLGLGTVIIGAFDAAQAEKILNVPKDYRVVALFPIGVPEQPGKAPPRKELSEIAIKDKFSK
ncbi:MAG: nitroreductase family protein [Dehalococcoidales bacterium]